MPAIKISSTLFKRNNKPPSLSEASVHPHPPQLSILAADGTQICGWMYCKDYINDTVWVHKTDRKSVDSVHGWTYDVKRYGKLANSHLMLAMRWKERNDKMAQVRENVIRTVSELEKRLKIPTIRRSRFSELFTDDGEGNNYFIIFGSRSWMKSIACVSFFTWLLRSAATHNKGSFEQMKPFNQRDRYYMKSGNVFIQTLLKDGFKKMRSDWSTISDIYSVHDSGFVAWSSAKGAKSVDYNDVGMDEEWNL